MAMDLKAKLAKWAESGKDEEEEDDDYGLIIDDSVVTTTRQLPPTTTAAAIAPPAGFALDPRSLGSRGLSASVNPIPRTQGGRQQEPARMRSMSPPRLLQANIPLIATGSAPASTTAGGIMSSNSLHAPVAEGNARSFPSAAAAASIGKKEPRMTRDMLLKKYAEPDDGDENYDDLMLPDEDEEDTPPPPSKTTAKVATEGDSWVGFDGHTAQWKTPSHKGPSSLLLLTGSTVVEENAMATNKLTVQKNAIRATKSMADSTTSISYGDTTNGDDEREDDSESVDTPTNSSRSTGGGSNSSNSIAVGAEPRRARMMPSDLSITEPTSRLRSYTLVDPSNTLLSPRSSMPRLGTEPLKKRADRPLYSGLSLMENNGGSRREPRRTATMDGGRKAEARLPLLNNPRRPILLRNTSRNNEPLVIGKMRYDPVSRIWVGNEEEGARIASAIAESERQIRMHAVSTSEGPLDTRKLARKISLRAGNTKTKTSSTACSPRLLAHNSPGGSPVHLGLGNRSISSADNRLPSFLLGLDTSPDSGIKADGGSQEDGACLASGLLPQHAQYHKPRPIFDAQNLRWINPDDAGDDKTGSDEHSDPFWNIVDLPVDEGVAGANAGNGILKGPPEAMLVGEECRSDPFAISQERLAEFEKECLEYESFSSRWFPNTSST